MRLWSVWWSCVESLRPAFSRGRRRVYGEKVRLRDLFDEPDAFTEAASPIYGEKGVTLRYCVADLLWRPVGVTVRFVLVIHPTRGRKILLCTDTATDSLEIICLYGVRFKIEVSFKQAIHTLGAYGYHFWMMKTTGYGPTRLLPYGDTMNCAPSSVRPSKICSRIPPGGCGPVHIMLSEKSTWKRLFCS